MLTSLALVFRRFLPNPEKRDSQEQVPVIPLSSWQFDSGGNSYTASLLRSFSYWELLPAAAVTAPTDKLTLLIGANTPVAAQSASGGLSLTTGATATNQSGVAGIAATGFAVPVRANNNVVFRTRVQLASLATMLATIGLGTAVASIVIAQAAADSAQFLADPTNSLTGTTGATNAQALNWIICTNVAGVSTYIFTNIPLVAAVDVDLLITINPNLTYNYYINGVLVGTSVTPATVNAALRVLIGVETLAAATANMLVRYAQLERSIG